MVEGGGRRITRGMRRLNEEIMWATWKEDKEGGVELVAACSCYGEEFTEKGDLLVL